MQYINLMGIGSTEPFFINTFYKEEIVRMIPKIRFLKKTVSFKEGQKATLKILNDSPKEARIQLKLAGSTRYRIAKQDLKLTLKPHQEKAIPVTFSTVKQKGWPIARNVKHEAVLQIWDTSGKQLIDASFLKGRGPAFVPTLHCLSLNGVRPRKNEKHRSPPSVFIETVIPGTSISVNTGTIQVNWDVDGADEIYEVHGGPGAEVLPDNTATDWGEWSGPPTSSDHGTFTYTPGGTSSFGITARNEDGPTYKSVVMYHTEEFGYHDTCTPAGGSIYESELDLVRGYLQSIEAKIRTDRLVHLADYIERWNAAAPASYQFPEEFDDMDYLTGRVGSGNLADDMLETMQSMLVYLKPYTLPEGYRPGTVTDPGFRTLCEDGQIYGKTIWFRDYPARSWLGICLELGADDLTLLHELYHLTTHKDEDIEEMKAIAVSWCCFDEIPW